MTAEVKTRYTVGGSVIPGTENEHGTAKARAVIEFRCTFKATDKLFTFECDDRDGFVIDPTDPDPDPEPWADLSKSLFAVHLAD
ncbi:hypothetical protein NKH18_32725 [Streptomyces sp. M10(2022)]